jgi:AcrR family transcriptional regulator
MTAAATKAGLRERKKLRTRQRIVDVATRLFLEQGYQQTTLVQIAEEVEVALSTLFNYFATKVDIVFCITDGVIESARRRIGERPAGEDAIHAVAAWLTEELPRVEQPYAEAIRRLPAIIGSSPELRVEERLRQALLEDVLAAGFARDLGESPDGMRARVLAAMALHGMLEAWSVWYEKHATDAEFQLDELLAAKADYVLRVLESGRDYIDRLPAPDELR